MGGELHITNESVAKIILIFKIHTSASKLHRKSGEVHVYSAPGMTEELINDRISFRKFLDIREEDDIPDETTICKFKTRGK